MHKKNAIDFLVIGAQKSGTTTLYQYLKVHPSIVMPREKEVRFFSHDENYKRGVDWYIAEYFPEEKEGILGEASPQYMTCLYASSRIAKNFPNVKLIVILRNPIDRCYSAYRMQYRRGLEKRSFEQVLEFVLKEELLIKENEYLGKKEYIRMGMYGSILKSYKKYFSQEQVHICFLEDLELNPALELKKLYAFLGVDDSFEPLSLGKKFHQGGKPKYKILHQALVLTRKVKPLLPGFIQRKLRGIGYWTEQWNISQEVDVKLTTQQREILAAIYGNEVRIIEKDFNIKVPWKDFGYLHKDSLVKE